MVMMAYSRIVVLAALGACLLTDFAVVSAAFESAGCSDEGCGIPCYMRPATDSCHYKPHSPCSNEGYDLDLENLILDLNSSLHRLEHKLVQKRVIPAGETCRPLDPISNGGIIYSDLLLVPGVVAHYVCLDGYVLHGHGKRECAPDGGWMNSEMGNPVCRDSSVRCQPLVPIPFGHVLYEAVDSTVLQPGDMVMYKCDAPYMLKGDPYRVCVTNGSWTGEEPSCTELEIPTSGVTGGSETAAVTQTEGVNTGKRGILLIAGATAGAIGGVLIAVVIVSLAIWCICRKCKSKKGLDDRYKHFKMKMSSIKDDSDVSTLNTALLEEESTDVKLKPLMSASASNKTETLEAGP